MSIVSHAWRNRWRAWVPPVLAVALVAGLFWLAAANVVVKANWHEVVDGVLWTDRAGALTAAEVGPGEAGDLAGIEVGDLLQAIDGVLVETAADVVVVLHAGQPGAELTYSLVRFGQDRIVEVLSDLSSEWEKEGKWAG